MLEWLEARSLVRSGKEGSHVKKVRVLVLRVKEESFTALWSCRNDLNIMAFVMSEEVNIETKGRFRCYKRYKFRF